MLRSPELASPCSSSSYYLPSKAGGERRSILPDLCLGPRGRYESVFRKIKQAFCFGLLGFEHGLKSDCPTGLTVGSSCILLVLI